MHHDFGVNSKSLRETWTQIANSNRDGDPNSIDSSEQESYKGSIWFVEEGMTEEEFYAKNYAIFDTQPKMKNGMYIHKSKPKEKLSTAVSREVNRILQNGELEDKKDIVIGKINYLDDETQKWVLELLSPDDRAIAEEKINVLKQIEERDSNNKTEILDGETSGTQPSAIDRHKAALENPGKNRAQFGL